MSKKKTIYSNNTVTVLNGNTLVGNATSSTTISLSAYGSGGFVTSGYYSIAEKCKYNIMGEDIEFNQSRDSYTAINISILNTMGWKYYEELNKNNVTFDGEVGELLEKMYKAWLRESKIDNILENKKD